MAFFFPLRDLDETKALAGALAPHLARGDILALWGELGTGKTEFARALLYAAGIRGDVPSPTYTLIQTYKGQDYTLYHFDLYRLKSENELDELGWDDALSDGVALIEWPQHAGGRLPSERLDLHFALDVLGTRSCTLEKHGNWEKRLESFS